MFAATQKDPVMQSQLVLQDLVHQSSDSNSEHLANVDSILIVNELVEKVQFERRGENVNNRPTLMHDELQRYTDYIYNFV